MRRTPLVHGGLLATLTSLWLVLLALHIVNDARGRLVQPGVVIAAPERPEGLPVVLSIRPEVDDGRSGLHPGDVLLRVGKVGLTGAGPLRFFASSLAALGPDRRATLVYERQGEQHDGWLDFAPLLVPIRFYVVSLSFALTGILALWRSPRSRAARAYFYVGMIVGLAFLRPWGGPEVQTYLWFGGAMICGAVFGPALIFCARSLREPPGTTDGFARVWPWLSAPVGMSHASSLVGVSLFGADSDMADPVSMILLNLFGAGLLLVLTHSYIRSGPLGRRKLKWVLLGLYMSLVPVLLLTTIELSRPQLWWLSEASEVFHVLIPLSLFAAIVRFNLFDIDRLISATASISFLGAVLLVGLVTAIPQLAHAGSSAIGIEPQVAQVILSVLAVAVLVPAYRHVRPRVDRLIFPEREALMEGIDGLLAELSEPLNVPELTTLAAERLDGLLRPESCVVYAGGGSAYEPIFVRGNAVPPVIAGGSPLTSTLEGRSRPLASERVAPKGTTDKLSPFDRAVLDTLGAAVVVPVRRGSELVAFLCLGSKCSGDIYTTTDLSLLGSVASAMSTRLERLDEAQVARQARAMQEQLRRYVPGAILRELEAGEDVESRECPVSVLFVDIRGHTPYAERRGVHEVFSTINRYTKTVSSIVEKFGGSVVEFNGDGMMAVFGAPRVLRDKERAAVSAGVAMVGQVASIGSDGEAISVGVGIATGAAFVGNVQAADRVIWTALGDTTNLAARLQGLTRDLDARIVIDLATKRGAGAAAAEFEFRKQVSIRGRSQQEDLYLLPLEEGTASQ